MLATVAFFLGATTAVRATHLQAGEIRYAPLNGYTYRIEVIVHTKLSAPADAPEILVELDGLRDTVYRTSYVDLFGSVCEDDTRRNVYQLDHTFPGPGSYTVRTEMSNRNGSIVNIPNSIAQTLSLSTVILISPELGPNTSVHFEASPQAWVWEWGTLVYRPLAVDDDGDELSFDLVTPLGLNYQEIVGYTYPQGSEYTWLDPVTGVFLWRVPLLGEYVIALRCTERRNGQWIGEVVRDMNVGVGMYEVGVADADRVPGFNLGPSPTEGPVTVNSTRPGRMRVSSSTGAVVHDATLPLGTSSLDATEWSPGVYAVEVRFNDGTVRTERLVRY